MQEPRRFVRSASRLPVTYTALPHDTPKVSLSANVSGGGISLFATSAFPSGTQLQISLTLPDEESPVACLSEVVWSERSSIQGSEDPQASSVGVRIIEIAPRDQDRLMHYVTRSLETPLVAEAPAPRASTVDG